MSLVRKLLQPVRDWLKSVLQTESAMDYFMLGVLEKDGCPLNDIHEIDHAFVCRASVKPILVEKLRAVGLKYDKAADSKDDDEFDGVKLLHFSESATPESMPDRAAQLRQIAKECGAGYDGWGSGCPNSRRNKSP